MKQQVCRLGGGALAALRRLQRCAQLACLLPHLQEALTAVISWPAQPYEGTSNPGCEPCGIAEHHRSVAAASSWASPRPPPLLPVPKWSPAHAARAQFSPGAFRARPCVRPSAPRARTACSAPSLVPPAPTRHQPLAARNSTCLRPASRVHSVDSHRGGELAVVSAEVSTVIRAGPVSRAVWHEGPSGTPR